MIDPKTLEHEFDPRGGDMGRNQNWIWDGQNLVKGTSTQGISPEDVDLRGYRRFMIGRQDVFPVHSASGGLEAVEWRAWWREDQGRYYCIVFENWLSEAVAPRQ